MGWRTFSALRKWFYVAVVAMGSLLVTCTSSLYTMTYDQLMDEFGCSLEICNLGLSLYMIGLALGPLLFSPMSEVEVLLSSCFELLLTSISVLRTAPNLHYLDFFPPYLVDSVRRRPEHPDSPGSAFPGGLSGSAFLGVAAGTVVDMFIPQQLLVPMTAFTGAPFVGPALGPVMGGFINSFTDWRWCFYVQIIWAAVIFLCVLITPETFHPVLLSRKAAKLRKDTGNNEYYSSLLQAVLYMCFSAFGLVFGNNHGFNLWQIGLSFLGLAVGNVIACLCNPFWHKQWMGSIAKEKPKHGAEYKPQPELRLPPAIVGGPMLTAALFWFAWMTYSSVHWIVPIIATLFFSTAFFFLFQGIWTFLVAAYPKHAASVMAVNTTTRCSRFRCITTSATNGLRPWLLFDLGHGAMAIRLLQVRADFGSEEQVRSHLTDTLCRVRPID
ncbi:uncharacterized protein Z518_01776 [Rhinocladiella mackenziei CBS 650.93]|uniref:Major facilitator superfamily (MFS) profile domain-containing protein n=1 Tax=Rhinocladiella mackenziei CBS 650.93 TaxID=1442369 RepID=A0A0D2G6U8_9EURO|nr:uncharacterized protein Z518_01776 [Rhinocladiella mackenziei CBS 650.93]KIX10692.1 hypothetical protein Z518_01776 [Rhinocladiella mackenziei CBS 650.93]